MLQVKSSSLSGWLVGRKHRCLSGQPWCALLVWITAKVIPPTHTYYIHKYTRRKRKRERERQRVCMYYCASHFAVVYVFEMFWFLLLCLFGCCCSTRPIDICIIITVKRSILSSINSLANYSKCILLQTWTWIDAKKKTSWTLAT